jgi:rfaE bifunctional protein nucleotidyltransferase chain/domain
MLNDKIKSVDEISEIAEKLRSEGKTVVTTNGSFDILHVAHVNLLEKAKVEGDVLIVLLNSDSSIKRFKGETRPIVSENERARIIAGLESVDYVVIFDEDKPTTLLEKIKPHVHVKGGSFVPERIAEETAAFLEWDGKFKNFDLEEGFSTTNIIDRIKNS